jgi:hypothetical protein
MRFSPMFAGVDGVEIDAIAPGAIAVGEDDDAVDDAMDAMLDAVHEGYGDFQDDFDDALSDQEDQHDDDDDDDNLGEDQNCQDDEGGGKSRDSQSKIEVDRPHKKQRSE